MTQALAMLGLSFIGLVALLNLDRYQRRRNMAAEERRREDSDTNWEASIW